MGSGQPGRDGDDACGVASIPVRGAVALPARTPVARSRLWAIAAHRIQAELAPKRPEGRWARGPSMRSAKTVSMMAWWRWVMSACGDRVVGVGEEAVIPPDREQARRGSGRP